MLTSIINKIKKLFGKNKSSEVGIITFDNLITIPTRNDLKEDKTSIDKIDKYKHDYLAILSNKHTITSHRLGEYNGISDNIKMYTDIYSRIILDEEELFEYQIANKTELVLRKLDIKNKLLKINLYLNDLSNLEKEIILHLISLKEIKKEKVFFSPLRKRTLEEEINTLIMSLININSQKRAIEIETNTSLKNHELLTILNEEVNDEEQELIDMYYDSLMKLIEKLNINSNINSSNKLLAISQIEKDIEIYAYKNKINKDELMIEILRYKLKSLKDEISKSNSPESYKSLVKYYERKYKKYYEDKLIDEEDMLGLYEIKFYIITSDINSKDKINIVEESNSFEFEFYKKIMENILKRIFEDDSLNHVVYNGHGIKDWLYERLYKNTWYSRYVNAFDIMKETFNSSEFNYYKILEDKEMLSYILGIYKTLDGFTDSKNTLENFYESLPIENDEINNLDSIAESVGLTINEDAKKSKMTIYLIWDLYYRFYDWSEDIDCYEVMPYSYRSYFLTYRCFNEKLYKKGDGIVEITSEATNKASFLLPPTCYYRDIFCKRVDNEKEIYDLVLPASLKKIEGPVYRNRHFRKVILNDGLKELSNNVFNNCTIEELTLPCSIEKFLLSKPKTIYNLVINDFDKVDLESYYMRRIIHLIFDTDIVYNKIGIKFKLNSATFNNVSGKQVVIYPEDIDEKLYFDIESISINKLYKPIISYLKDLIIKKLNEKEEYSAKVRVLK